MHNRRRHRRRQLYRGAGLALAKRKLGLLLVLLLPLLLGSGLVGGGGGGGGSPGTGDITDVFSCSTGDCTAVTVQNGETLNASGTGTIDATDVVCTGCLSATELAADSVGSSELATGAVDEVAAALDGTGLAVDTSTTPDEIDIATTEVTGNRTWGDGTDASITWSWALTGGFSPAIEFGPNDYVTITDTGNITLEPDYSAFVVDGTVDYNDPGTSISIYRLNSYYSNRVYSSSDAPGPLYPDTFHDSNTISYSGAGAMNTSDNPFQPYSFVSTMAAQVGGAGVFAITDFFGTFVRPTFDRDSAGTITAESAGGMRLTPPLSASTVSTATVTDYVGLDMDFTGTSGSSGRFNTLGSGITLTNLYGMKLDDLDDGTNNYTLWSDSPTASMRHAGPAIIGAGATTATQGSVLDVLGAFGIYVDTDAGDLSIGLNLMDGAETFTTLSNFGALTTDGTYTIFGSGASYSGYAVGTTAGSAAGGVTFDFDTSAGSLSFFAFWPRITTDDITAAAYYSRPFYAGARFDADTVDMYLSDTIPIGADFSSVPIFDDTGAGTYDPASVRAGFMSRPTVAAATAYREFRGYQYHSASLTGTMETQVGFDIAALSGATTNIGIRNADTYVATPAAAQAIAAAGDNISCDAHFKKFTTVAGTTTLTDNPIITDGVDGQICILTNTDATGTDCLTFTDATQGLQLGANRTMCPNDVLTLIYNGTDWIEQDWADN